SSATLSPREHGACTILPTRIGREHAPLPMLPIALVAFGNCRALICLLQLFSAAFEERLMGKKTNRTGDGQRRGINDDIGEEKRLTMYRMQVEIRESEQRAFDLFLQNLVKGTSHLSLGQEAVAAGFAAAMQPGDLSFCTYRGHAHTLARGVPIEKVLGELMQRDNGLMRGKG